MNQKTKSKRQIITCGQVVLTGFGCLSILFGVFLITCWEHIFNKILFSQIALKPDSKTYQFWSSPPQPLYLDIYLFNWTNPEDINDVNIKPIMKEIGPFRFQEIPQKVNVRWHNDNDTVSYRKQSQYIFISEQSRGRLDDMITSVNVIALSAATRAKDWSWFKAKGVSIGLKSFNQKVHVTKKASEWLFDGYEDVMINIAKDNPLLDAGNIPYDKFGWFYMRNNTNDLLGDFNVKTGVNDINQIGKIMKWNYESSTSYFDGKCNDLSGSGGDFFVPGIKKEQTLELFSPEMCRSIPMDFEKEQNILGVNTFKFSGGERSLDNGTIYPENECYCGGNCVPSGVFNISSCRYGAPVFMSYPHFYSADSFYLDQVVGMEPQQEKHQFFMSFEPKVAIPLEVAARFQINLLIEPISTISLYEKVQKKFMPILWFEQHVKMSESIVDEVKLLLRMPGLGQKMGFVTIIIGILQIICIPTFKTLEKRLCKSEKSKVVDCVEITMLTKEQEISPLMKKQKPNHLIN